MTDYEPIWQRIKAHQREQFQTLGGLCFRYWAMGEAVEIELVRGSGKWTFADFPPIDRRRFETVYQRMLQGETSEAIFPEELRAPYLWGILSDPRIWSTESPTQRCRPSRAVS